MCSSEIESNHTNLFLVGPMGAGKTTIGKLIATELKYDFVDTDVEIEKKAGVNITIIFDIEGEEGFRARESKVLDEISIKDHQVVATGGGIILAKGNREKIKKTGICIYLSASAEQLYARIGKDKKRPLLNVPDGPESVLKKIVETRDHLYREVADIVVHTNSRPPRQLAKEISRKVTAMIALNKKSELKQ